MGPQLAHLSNRARSISQDVGHGVQGQGLTERPCEGVSDRRGGHGGGLRRVTGHRCGVRRRGPSWAEEKNDETGESV